MIMKPCKLNERERPSMLASRPFWIGGACSVAVWLALLHWCLT